MGNDLVIRSFRQWVVLQVHRTSHNRHSTFDSFGCRRFFHSSYERPRYISCAKPFYLKQVHSAPSALKTGAASEPQARAAPASGLGDHAVDGITPVREPQAAQRT